MIEVQSNGHKAAHPNWGGIDGQGKNFNTEMENIEGTKYKSQS